MARKGVGLKNIAGCGNCWGSRPFQGKLSYQMCGTNHLPCHLTLTIGETLSKHGNFGVNDHHVGSILAEDGALSEHLKREVLGTCFCCWSLMESVISTPNSCQTPSPIKYTKGIPDKNDCHVAVHKFLGIFTPLSHNSCPKGFQTSAFLSLKGRPPWEFNQLETKVAKTAKHDRIVETHNPQGPIRLGSVFFRELISNPGRNWKCSTR